MTDDDKALVERLRANDKEIYLPILAEAADRIEAQAAEIERLREEVKSLRPKPTITKETHTCVHHGDNCQEHNLHCGWPSCAILRTGKAEQ